MAGPNLWSLLLLVVLIPSEPPLGPVKAELEKLGVCPNGFYGYSCRQRCHCQRDSTACNDNTGYCPTDCIDGWSGPTCQSQNVAFGMPSRVRAVAPHTNAQYAVDGNTSTCVYSTPDAPGWLRVDLQTTTTVYRVSLVTENLVSTRGWQVFVTDYEDFFWAAACATLREHGPQVHTMCDTPTSGRYLALLNTEGPLSVCEVQVHVCAEFSFGSGCEFTCRCADVSEVCHPLTGRCTTGCVAGYRGRNCQTECINSYGPNCVTPCGHCVGGRRCDPVTGRCPGGCEDGWAGENCNFGCPRGYYGAACSRKCGHCQDKAPCTPDTGHCPGLCQSGWGGPRCDRGCLPGFYGPSCSFSCGRCLNGSTCSTHTGICPHGCNSGWEGLFCTQECLPRHHGPNCVNSCPQCMTSCDSRTGLCDSSGCAAGLKGERCGKECDRGYYGANCNETCGPCALQPCDVITGDCPRAVCQPGWLGASCKTPCTPGTFGANCSHPCGLCKDRAPCDPVTGYCPGPCAEGYYGDRCTDKNIFAHPTSQTFIALLVTVLTVTAALLVGVFVCLALKWRRDKDLYNVQSAVQRCQKSCLHLVRPTCFFWQRLLTIDRNKSHFKKYKKAVLFSAGLHLC